MSLACRRLRRVPSGSEVVQNDAMAGRRARPGAAESGNHTVIAGSTQNEDPAHERWRARPAGWRNNKMRNLKKLSLAAVAVFALVAFAGAGAASATSLCATPAVTMCPSPLAAHTLIRADLKTGVNAVLTTSGGLANPTLTCTASSVTITTTSAGGTGVTDLPGDLTGLTFTGCSSMNPSGCTNTGEVAGLPKSGSVMWSSGSNGTFTVNAPTVSFTCPIAGFPVTCAFGGNGDVTGSFTGGNPATVQFTNQSIASTGGFGCPTAAQWNATYSVTTPNPLYLTNG